MSTILITGGSGLVGTALTAALLAQDHDVRHLTRAYRKVGPVRSYLWDVTAGKVDPAALEGVDHIVHLSGAGIADKRWTKARLHELLASRAEASRLLMRTARAIGHIPKSFISASGIGYYGAITSEHFFTEEDPAGGDTIGQLTRAWELAVDEWNPHCRVVKLRTAPVLAPEGGVLAKLVTPARWGLSTPFGSGEQWMPWIYIDDLVRVYQLAIADGRMHGAFNVCASEQPTNRDFIRGIAQALNKPFFLPPVPAFALELALGELAAVLLQGSRTSNAKLSGMGYHPTLDRLENALRVSLQ